MPMWKRKWFIPVVVVSVLLVGGIVGGLVAASDSATNTENQSQATDRYEALLDRACTIYEDKTDMAVDPEQLKNALNQAQGELRNEALESRLLTLVEDGKMTQEEADQYLEWWQSRPEIEAPLPGLGGPGPGGGMMWGRSFGPWDGLCHGPDDSGQSGGQ